MNMFKKNGGFTLVELIVVIAILAILAAVAVPAYSGYISKANEAADLTQLDAIKTAANFAHFDKYKENPATITVTPVADTDAATAGNQPGIAVATTGTGTNAITDISAYYPTPYQFQSTKFANGAVWDGSDWVPAT